MHGVYQRIVMSLIFFFFFFFVILSFQNNYCCPSFGCCILRDFFCLNSRYVYLVLPVSYLFMLISQRWKLIFFSLCISTSVDI